MKDKIRALIIDDDFSSRKMLSCLLTQLFPDIKVLTAEYAMEGMAMIAKYKPELVFLDLIMPHGTGFELLEAIPDRNFAVIITSGDDSMKPDVLKVGVTAFIEKPIERNFFYDIVNNVLRTIKEKLMYPTILSQDIKPELIIRAEADGSYCKIFQSDHCRFTLSKNLSNLEKLLPTTMFFRPQRSHLINLHHVVKYHLSGRPYIIMSCGCEVPLRRDKRMQFREALQKN